jgi:carbamoyl-phosphate synthase large subunit
MPRRPDLDSVLIIGSGPIVIGQACEFDYSGTQAVKALRGEGVRVVLINSNPATIMTDPELADATYVEPLTVEVLDRVLAKEKPRAVLPTLGGQTGLNLALAAHQAGVLAAHGVELIGASVASIEMAEDRERFKQAMARIGLACPRSRIAGSVEAARACASEIGFPAILRPSFTLGGAGGGIARDAEELDRLAAFAIAQSPVRQVLVEESVLGWKEFELEVMRDARDNCVIVCSIENVDPMGVHTGDSITVAPAMTLTDKEYQRMRDAAIAIMREIGVTTGGSNVQFAVEPATGRMIVIEMNPRVSRSSALASKATGFPIAKLAAKLAIGYTLDELRNDITRVTPASFEPTIDYVVVKWPRFAFEKFPAARRVLGPQMKSVGEAMAIGRTFREALGKAIRSLETGQAGFDLPLGRYGDDRPALERAIAEPGPDRLFQVGRAFQLGLSVERAHELSRIDPWFLGHVRELALTELEISRAALGAMDLGSDVSGMGVSVQPHGLGVVRGELRRYKRLGLSDRRIAALAGATEDEVRAVRAATGVAPVYKRVDTCGAELEAYTPYLYSTYEDECEARPTDRKKVVILGGGPNRIGQGIEFDYCCVHAASALSADGFETIMVNCNPETVSTDYDTSDRLYFEPVTLEDVLAVCAVEAPWGVIVQFGGQTPLKLARPLAAAGVPLIGTTADAIDRAEDRERFGAMIEGLGLRAPRWGIARTLTAARAIAKDLGFPVMVRPSYVLGGRAMQRIADAAALEAYFQLLGAGTGAGGDESAVVGFPLLVDQFLRDAIEVDVDVVADATGAVVVGGVMEHVELAGIHSGDSACALPPYSLAPVIVDECKRIARALAVELGVVGLMNVQLAVCAGEVFVLEVNPRASRTIPFVSKAIGVPLAKVAARVMAGKTLAELGVVEVTPPHVSVKEVVFPFVKFDSVDPFLGPEMRSTGEVMGIDADFPRAFGKSQVAAGARLPTSGTVLISSDDDTRELATRLTALGFDVTTDATAAAIAAHQIALVIATAPSAADLRRAAVLAGVPYVTTLRGALATVAAIEARGALDVRSLQSL